MKRTALFISVLSLILIATDAFAAKFVVLKAVDKDYLMVYFKDGDVCFVDDGAGTLAFTGEHQTANNYAVNYTTALDVNNNAVNSVNWTIKSSTDSNYGTTGLHPSNCYRKSRMNGMAEMDWGSNDWIYIYTMEHWIFLRLPSSLSQGTTYTLEINSNTGSDVTSKTITFDIFNSPSEAIHTNLVGYINDDSVKAVDLYQYMGNGGARDYSSFVGKKVYLYNVDTSTSQEVNTVSFWLSAANEMWISSGNPGHNITGSNVWKADFTGYNSPGTFRVAIEGVGCSENFEIKADAYFEPFRVSTIGFFYMRVGQATYYTGMPVPRKPLYIPGVSPSNTKVYITTMQPSHPSWDSITNDKWDHPTEWAAYKKPGNPLNNNATGGHSDATDWDRHLGHISNIYDMLLPYILTDGKLNDDDLGIAESGNGIPDVLDEARNEVDFWLNLRDGNGYSFGVTNPVSFTDPTLYQAGNYPLAAWASAANAAMLGYCFELAGLTDLANTYRDAAITAYNYIDACSVPNQMLDTTLGVGDGTVRGKDLKIQAAAYLYNLTGNTAYESVVNSLSDATSDTSEIVNSGSKNQLWASAGYLKTKRTVNYPLLYSRMKNSIINEAKTKEANFSSQRPTRRATDNTTGWFMTDENVQRCIVAHSIADNPSDKALFENAIILTADWGLGRNNMNTIIMTTACTPLENKRSIRNAYTTGRDDGSFGLHPGHTPYLNTRDWDTQPEPGGMTGNRPSRLAAKCYPAYSGWPEAEGYFDTRYIWAHSEFTPQQTMRGKQAIYGYLYGLTKPAALTPDFDGLAVLCDSWLKVPADPGYDARANMHDDPAGIVDLADFAAFANNWNPPQ